MKSIEERVTERLIVRLQRIRRDLDALGRSHEGRNSLRYLNLRDQRDLLEEILGAGRSFPPPPPGAP